MPMTQEEAKALVEKHGSITKASVNEHMSHRRLRRVLAGGPDGLTGGVPQKDHAKPSSGIVARTLDDFRQEHDQTFKIRDGLKRLFCAGVYMTDCEFRDAVRGNPARWRSAAEAAEFRDNRYRVAGELLWASKQTIREMRRIRGEAI